MWLIDIPWVQFPTSSIRVVNSEVTIQATFPNLPSDTFFLHQGMRKSFHIPGILFCWGKSVTDFNPGGVKENLLKETEGD